MRFVYALTTVILVVFIINSGFEYYLGSVEGLYILFACAIFFPVYIFILTIAFARLGIPGNVAQEEKPPLDQILDGEGNKVRGWATIVFGIVVGSVALVLAYIFTGLDNPLLDAMVLIVAISGSGFFVLLGVADILSDAKFVRIAVITAFGGLIPDSAFLASGTLRIEAILVLALVVAEAVWAYFLIWRTPPRDTALNERN